MLGMPPVARSGIASANAFQTAICIVSAGQMVASAVEAGYWALQTDPSGASALMCRKQPSLCGIVGSIMHMIGIPAAACITPYVLLLEPGVCSDEPAKSTYAMSSLIVTFAWIGIFVPPWPSVSSQASP